MPGVETLVLAGVGEQHALLFAEDVIDDGAAYVDAILVASAAAPADSFWLQLPAAVVAQHDAAAVGLDGAKHEFENALQEIVQIEDVADRLAGLVHDRQVGQGGPQPNGLHLFGLGEDAAALGSGDGLDDGRRKLQIVAGNEADFFRQIAGLVRGLLAGAAEHQHGLAKEDLIAGMHRDLPDDLLVVDVGAIGAAVVEQIPSCRRACGIRRAGEKLPCRAAATRWSHPARP